MYIFFSYVYNDDSYRWNTQMRMSQSWLKKQKCSNLYASKSIRFGAHAVCIPVLIGGWAADHRINIAWILTSMILLRLVTLYPFSEATKIHPPRKSWDNGDVCCNLNQCWFSPFRIRVTKNWGANIISWALMDESGALIFGRISWHIAGGIRGISQEVSFFDYIYKIGDGFQTKV